MATHDVPTSNNDCLDYVAKLFDLESTDVPVDAIVILGFMGDKDKHDGGELDSGMYWRYRVGGEGVTATLVGLAGMFQHFLMGESASDE